MLLSSSRSERYHELLSRFKAHTGGQAASSLPQQAEQYIDDGLEATQEPGRVSLESLRRLMGSDLLDSMTMTSSTLPRSVRSTA